MNYCSCMFGCLFLDCGLLVCTCFWLVWIVVLFVDFVVYDDVVWAI